MRRNRTNGILLCTGERHHRGWAPSSGKQRPFIVQRALCEQAQLPLGGLSELQREMVNRHCGFPRFFFEGYRGTPYVQDVRHASTRIRTRKCIPEMVLLQTRIILMDNILKTKKKLHFFNHCDKKKDRLTLRLSTFSTNKNKKTSRPPYGHHSLLSSPPIIQQYRIPPQRRAAYPR